MADAVDPRARPVLVRPLARFLLGVFFRRVEVVGAERLPRDRPLMIVANHNNSLIDAALLVAYLPVTPRFLAKSTLWSHPVVSPFLRLAAAIPVYRRQDAGVDPAQNERTFAACHAVLAAGGAVALFPEGVSHSEPALVPLKTGVARIVLEAEAKLGGEAGLGTRIVPVGLVFDDKGRFRSRALVLVGEPLDPAPELARYTEAPRDAVRDLTARVSEGLAAVTLNFPSWEEARLIERAAEIFERPTSQMPAEWDLGERVPLRQTFIRGYARLAAEHPGEVERVAEAVRRYDARLVDYRLRDAQVAAEYPLPRVGLFVVKSLALMALRAPLALLGTVVHAVPYWTVARLAERFAATPDLPATYKLLASFLIYPLTWASLAILAGLAAATAGATAGLSTALATAVVAPASAYFALRYRERGRYFQREARAYLLLRSGRPGIAELRRLRAEVLVAVGGLAAVIQAAEGASTSPPPAAVATSPEGTRSPKLDVQ